MLAIFIFVVQTHAIILQNVYPTYQQALMSNAVVGEVQQQWNEELPDNFATFEKPPVSILSGYIPDFIIKKWAEYLFTLLNGTGDVVKPKNRRKFAQKQSDINNEENQQQKLSFTMKPEGSETNPSTFPTMNVIQEASIVSSLNDVRMAPKRKWGISRMRFNDINSERRFFGKV
ncbi:unnamed protein product [Caenorhabditis bovis]|uniref:Uncharacterized protein n=1 Tax=Caenorhabditis bovis TaxID=2654633 RepID=A0A8S1EK98_9PELO|nr:unnamed protein product [Caenorhabditis bovis]